jgi:hypothetical protein
VVRKSKCGHASMICAAEKSGQREGGTIAIHENHTVSEGTWRDERTWGNVSDGISRAMMRG